MIKKILLLLSLLYGIIIADFIRHNSDNTVLDTSTLLIWQDDSAVIVNKNFSDANTTCNSLSIGQKTNWRVPSYNELYTLIDLSKDSIKIDDKFSNKEQSSYWASDIYANDVNSTWSINFASGYDSISNNGANIRCVHD